MTVDALAQAGVATVQSGVASLVATVNDYWLDGRQMYYANVEIELALHDPDGTAIWSHVVNGSGGDAVQGRNGR